MSELRMSIHALRSDPTARAVQPTLLDERGVAYIELLLVIFPFVLSVIFATFECGNLLQIKQNIAFVSREAGLYAHRECSPYQDNKSMKDCIIFVRARMENMAKKFVTPNAEVSLSIYERSLGVTTQLAKAPSAATASGFTSRIEAKMTTDAELTVVLDEQERVTVAEINAIYTPIFTRTLGWFLDFTDFDFYETAIY